MRFLENIFSNVPNEFATLIVEKIARQFPPESEKLLVKKGAQRRLEGVIGLVANELDDFQKTRQLNWLGKARFGNSFRWQLTDRGYSKEFVEALTEGIVRHLAPR